MKRSNIKATLPIIDFNELIIKSMPEQKKVISKHGILFPENVRCVIAGKSGCGKTNIVMNLVFGGQGIAFSNLYLFSKSLNQDKYKFMDRVFSNLKHVKFFKSSDANKIPHPSNIPRDSLVIFDDLQTSSPTIIKAYFSMGRPIGVSCMYLIQSYSATPKQLLRDNANVLIIFKMDPLNLRLIHRDFVEIDMSYDKFRNMCKNIWSKNEHNFVSIFTDSKKNEGKYRENLDKFITDI